MSDGGEQMVLVKECVDEGRKDGKFGQDSVYDRVFVAKRVYVYGKGV